jgi:hypothetical protein
VAEDELGAAGGMGRSGHTCAEQRRRASNVVASFLANQQSHVVPGGRSACTVCTYTCCSDANLSYNCHTQLGECCVAHSHQNSCYQSPTGTELLCIISLVVFPRHNSWKIRDRIVLNNQPRKAHICVNSRNGKN